MKFSVKKIVYESSRSLKTEAAYCIATARVEGYELLVFELDNLNMSERFINESSKLFRRFKREGNIQLFVTGAELSEAGKTEAEYLLNKYPKLPLAISSLGTCVCVKL